MTDNNGLQSNDTQEGQGRARPYVVLEQGKLIQAVRDLFERADVGLNADEWQRLDATASDEHDVTIYSEVARVPSRNSAHALTQVGARYEAGQTPPLVAVSERMFQPRQVSVSFDPRVSLT